MPASAQAPQESIMKNLALRTGLALGLAMALAAAPPAAAEKEKEKREPREGALTKYINLDPRTPRPNWR